MTYEDVLEIARGLRGVEERTCYGTPALKVRGRLFVRLKVTPVAALKSGLVTGPSGRTTPR